MVPATAASGTIHSGLALHIGERGAEIDVKGLAGDHQRRDRGDAGRLGFRDPSRRVAEMDDLDVILRGIERMGEALFCAAADRAPGKVKRRFLGPDEVLLPYHTKRNSG